VTRTAVALRPAGDAIRTGVPLALVGPTAAGKTEASVVLARRLDAEVVLVDSMTVYRGMDVGTAKPTARDRAAVPHHVLDMVDPAEGFSVAAFQRLATDAVDEIRGRGRAVLLVGGSGLYFRTVVDDLELPGTDPALRRALETEARVLGPAVLHGRLAGFDPAAAGRIDPTNARRTVRALEVAALTGRPFSTFARAWDRYPADRVRAAGVAVHPAALRARIEDRVARMLAGGLVDEVRGLLDRGAGPLVTASQAIGYAEVAEHLAGRMSLDQVRERMSRRTRHLARRQMAWFRRDPRIRWFPAGAGGAPEVVDDIEEYLTS
jgi:tRNA dimethylallyltransferase